MALSSTDVDESTPLNWTTCVDLPNDNKSHRYFSRAEACVIKERIIDWEPISVKDVEELKVEERDTFKLQQSPHRIVDEGKSKHLTKYHTLDNYLLNTARDKQNVLSNSHIFQTSSLPCHWLAI